MASIGIIGAGTRGTALVVPLSDNRHQMITWSAIPEEARELKKTRTHRDLPDLYIPGSIGSTEDLKGAMEDRDPLIPAVSSVFVRGIVQKTKPHIKKGQVITDVARGIGEDTSMILSQIIEEEPPEAEVAMLSGPNRAEGVSKDPPTTCVAGVRKKHVAEFAQGMLINQVFHVYTSPDILEIGLSGASEDVIALTSGMADGLGYGDNTKTALVIRGIMEISCLDTDMGGRMETFAGLTEIGDLIVTCASMHSRNRCAGILIGRSYTMEEVMAEVNMMMEGVYPVKATLVLSRQCHVSMPIIEQVNTILFGGMPAKEAVLGLVPRDKRIGNSGLEWEKE